jgi:hypothetical protein
MGQNFNISELSLRDIIRNQVRINDDVGKKIHATASSWRTSMPRWTTSQ